MKRLFTMILAFVLCACLCACGDKGYAVHVNAPDSWDSVNLWAWSVEDKKDAFEAWPGTAMTADGDGWYTATVPEWVDSVVVSGNGGTVQTEDIQYISREVWITVYEDLSNWRQYDEKPQYTTATVSVPSDWGTPNCWAWRESDKKDVFAAWPGQPMTQNGNYYTIELPAWVDSIVISNSDGSVQTTDLTVEPGKDFWAAVWSTGNADIVYSEADLEALKLSAEALYAALDTLDKDQIIDNKAIACVYKIEDGKELSKEPVLDLLPGEAVASTPEEIRYIVNVNYLAKCATNYIGLLKVYYTYINVEVVDLLTGDVITEETFPGEKLPEQISSKDYKYYAPYPDEAPVLQWAVDALADHRAANPMPKQTKPATEDSVANTPSQNSATNEDVLSQAKRYLEHGDGHSPKTLTEMLVDYSGFTKEQAAYAVENCGADWKEEALKVAKYWLEIKMGYSYSSMILVLEGDYGFTKEEAEYAASNCNADWDQVAADHVALFLEYSNEPYTREKMIQEMVDYFGFTMEQAIYGADQNGLK